MSRDYAILACLIIFVVVGNIALAMAASSRCTTAEYALWRLGDEPMSEVCVTK